ncbi:MAG: FG-GAP-like repeat-containing protein [Chitinophagaceae bacterium]
MKQFNYFIFIFFIVATIACNGKQQPDPLFTLMQNTGINFANNIHNTKDFNIFTYRNFYNGGGCAIGDINNDGLADVFFTANMGANKLYLNKGNFQFEDVSGKAGIEEANKWSTGVVMVDINADGWLDIYVCNAGYQVGMNSDNALFINNHDGTFTNKAKAYGLDNNGYTTHAAFFDYDIDGDLDCFILNNSFIPVNTLNNSNNRTLRAKDWPVADFLKGGGSFLMRNDGGVFTDVSAEANIYGSLISFGLGVTVGDVNGDHWPDIYVSNDFYEKDYLYINQRNGTFQEQLETYVQHTSLSSMGADMADINNDGYPDIFTTDMLPPTDYRLKTTSSFDNIDVQNLKERRGFYHQYQHNTLQINNHEGKFLETSFYSNVAASDWSWGGLIFDADNNGLSDLFVCNGIYHDVTDQDFIDFFANDIIQRMVLTGKKEEVDQVINKMPSKPIPNIFFRNNGNLQFEDASEIWGTQQPSFSNGAAYGDLDNDGDLDLIVNNVNAPAFIYQNTAIQRGAHYIAVQVKGTNQNTFAIGTTIKLYQGSTIQSREVIPSRGFQSSVDYKQLFGIATTKVDSIQIIFPNNTYVTFVQPITDTLLVVQQQGNEAKWLPPINATTTAFFTLKDSSSFLPHKEDDYIDFYTERNIPMMQSRQGPKSAVADYNNDGLQDIFIGGAVGSAAQLYLQLPYGKWQRSTQTLFNQYLEFEDTEVVSFDADGDGDADIMVGSGGNHLPQGSIEMRTRLYLNDGKGLFTSGNELPAVLGNTSVIAPFDVDNDGDTDVFVGSLCMPQNYGIASSNQLWINNGKGVFSAQTVAAFKSLGMVTDAGWMQLQPNGKPTLVIVGEFSEPQFFEWNGTTLVRKPTNLDVYKGMWQAVAVADLNNDGLQDLVIGNYGENFYLKPDSAHPVKLFINDFDGNGILDKVWSRTIDNKDVPVFLKRELTDNIPSLKKQNLRHEAYATKSVQALFSNTSLQQALVRTYNYTSSVIAYNNGNASFTIQKLPIQVQWSSVNAITITDINRDDKPDILLGGNLFHFLPQFARLDASYTHTLLNNDNHTWQYISNQKSGVLLRGCVKDIQTLQVAGNPNVLWLQNNERPVLYQLQK